MERLVVGARISCFWHSIIFIQFNHTRILLLYLGSYRFALSFLACICIFCNLLVLSILKLLRGSLSVCLHLWSSFAIKYASSSSACRVLPAIKRSGGVQFGRWGSWIHFSSSGGVIFFADVATGCCTLHYVFKGLRLPNSLFLLPNSFSLNSLLLFRRSLLFLLEQSTLPPGFFIQPFDFLQLFLHNILRFLWLESISRSRWPVKVRALGP